ncbi:MAG: PD-(D/E)XK nuclease-like domain-containing protein, partial [Dehalococcoidia bacterium]|nr:PD-(D/E)XK nuclease-like domain-containing protein [Dehalococcoidia bacterium]
IVWEEGGVVCRARLDWLHDGGAFVSDLKTTSRSANPDEFTRSIFSMGYDIQVAAYTRAVERTTGVTPEFRFVVVETAPPYALSVIALGPAALTIAEKKWADAVKTWKRCLDRDEWPGYPTRVAYAELPAWEESRWLERELREIA